MVDVAMMIMIADVPNQYADVPKVRPYGNQYTFFHKLFLSFLGIVFYYQQTVIYPNLKMSG